MAYEILTPDEMAQADRRAIEAGPLDGYTLMRNAGAAVAAEVLRRYPGAASFDVLCGPGNNGGDGYVVARLLAEAGCVVRVWALGQPRKGSDAALAARDCPVEPRALTDYRPEPHSVVIDALYGAGLDRLLDEAFAEMFEAIEDFDLPVVAIDLPSGLSGSTGFGMGPVLKADLTVTFVRKKPGHLLYPGPTMCGEVVVADIGLADRSIGVVNLRENAPAGWLDYWPVTDPIMHKYMRGHVGVFSGGPTATGAARLSAMAAARAGAGAVTVLSPANALAANAAHLTSIMLREAGSIDEVLSFIDERKPNAFVFGPGLETKPKVAKFLADLLRAHPGEAMPATFVVDASAITAAAADPKDLFAAVPERGSPYVVLTPHEGEFARLFPDLAADAMRSKVERARTAAKRSNAIVVLKGPDTVIAHPSGEAVINANGAAWLATAGSGDVLAGLIAGLVAQHMSIFPAVCAAVWIHAEAGAPFGPGLIAEDIPGLLPSILKELHGMRTTSR